MLAQAFEVPLQKRTAEAFVTAFESDFSSRSSNHTRLDMASKRSLSSGHSNRMTPDAPDPNHTFLFAVRIAPYQPPSRLSKRAL